MGKLTNERFMEMSRDYEEESTALKKQLGEAQTAIAEYKDVNSNSIQFVKLIKEYFDIEELSTEMLNKLVDKIVVHERDIVDEKRQQMVDIYYNFVGVIEQEEHTTKQRVRQFQVFDPTLLAEYYKKSVAL